MNRIQSSVGTMDTLVTLMRGVQSIGTEGEKEWTFSEHSRVWAKVDRSIAESVEDGNLAEGNSLTLTIYKVAELTTRWRVVVEGISYEISSIDPISRISPLCTLSVSAID